MDWINHFFDKNSSLILDSADQAEFKTYSIIKSVEEDDIILYPGADCLYLPFMLKGDLKVHRTAENGREVILYHIKNGESCILSALGIVNNSNFPATAVIEKSGEVLLVPAVIVTKYIDKYPGWRKYIFSMYNMRFTEVLVLVDEILFRKIDVRMARYLVNNKDKNSVIHFKTHQTLADELGSSREVISRILKSFSGKELIHYRRNEIELLNIKELLFIAQM